MDQDGNKNKRPPADVFKWISSNKGWSLFIAFLLFFVVPFVIDKLYSTPACISFLGLSYQSKDVLAFYGILLGSATTIVALIQTIQHADKIRALDYEQKMTPLLGSMIYNHSDTSISPYRSLYVNLRPMEYLEKVEVRLPTDIDLRDMED